jgi:hypothetical protein
MQRLLPIGVRLLSWILALLFLVVGRLGVSRLVSVDGGRRGDRQRTRVDFSTYSPVRGRGAHPGHVWSGWDAHHSCGVGQGSCLHRARRPGCGGDARVWSAIFRFGNFRGGEMRTSSSDRKSGLLVEWCGRGDSNPHALASASPSSWCVCQFRHFRKWEVRREPDLRAPIGITAAASAAAASAPAAAPAASAPDSASSSRRASAASPAPARAVRPCRSPPSRGRAAP